MIKKIITVLIIFAVLFGFYKITSQKPISIKIAPAPDTDLVLFYGDTCPHCKIVEEFISTNKINEKLKISQLEVYKDKSNSSLFSKMVNEICPEKLTADGLPVPFLINQVDKKCFIGDTPIKDYLTEKSK
ncbi:MAG: hypothetical protein PHE32_02690 [Candidatus Shapirobacteria bacterium]|nr:hypothetical protein [Candidatus Shapirobacteria bacterium]MDD4410580.1 hypothetical protein [Candidatus Shapirobacteria bacterium]